MNTQTKVAEKMAYIQELFLKVSNYSLELNDLDKLVALLDMEPEEFRSIGYESASMVIAAKDLKEKNNLINWTSFYNLKGELHPFHMQIGLGWAIAKAEAQLQSNMSHLNSSMIYDGMGYYYGLFKRKRTVDYHQVGEGIKGHALSGFDQGLGRRIWYISKGSADETKKLIEAFPQSRQTDLWRGVGVACGYVGGCDEAMLKKLSCLSAEYKQELGKGISMAALSRVISGSITVDIELACNYICGLALKDSNNINSGLQKHNESVFSVYDIATKTETKSNFLSNQF